MFRPEMTEERLRVIRDEKLDEDTRYIHPRIVEARQWLDMDERLKMYTYL
jgi:hypothetical protein